MVIPAVDHAEISLLISHTAQLDRDSKWSIAPGPSVAVGHGVINKRVSVAKCNHTTLNSCKIMVTITDRIWLPLSESSWGR